MGAGAILRPVLIIRQQSITDLTMSARRDVLFAVRRISAIRLVTAVTFVCGVATSVAENPPHIRIISFAEVRRRNRTLHAWLQNHPFKKKSKTV